MDLPVGGHCDERFAAVYQAFVANFEERGEVGAAVTLLVDGQPVVELVGGWASHSPARAWDADTLVDFYSVGKPFVALLVLQLVDEGALGLDDPIARVWPEFAVGGKASATVRHALCHRAGVPAIREPMVDDDLADWDRMCAAVAATSAWWEPGTRHAYHTNTYGHLLGEIAHRVSGELPGPRWRSLVESVGADLYFGVPVAEQHRCADVTFVTSGPLPATDAGSMSEEQSMVALGYFNPPGYSSIGIVNSAAWRSAQVPSTNGHGSATGIARLYRRAARTRSAAVSSAPR